MSANLFFQVRSIGKEVQVDSSTDVGVDFRNRRVTCTCCQWKGLSMESGWSQQLYFLILPPLVDSFVVVKRSPYACRVYRYPVLCSSSSHKGGTPTSGIHVPTQEDRWSLSKNHHYIALYTQPEDNDNNKVGGTR